MWPPQPLFPLFALRATILSQHSPVLTQPPYALTPDALVVLTTVANPDEAVELSAHCWTGDSLRAAHSSSGARSLYRWDGKLADEAEVVVLLKTRGARLPALTAAFGELHPYKVPEMLALPVVAGSDKYLSWIDKETSLALA